MRRILSIIIGVVAIIIGGIGIYGYFNPSLPKCDSDDSDTLLRQLVMKAAAEEPAVKNAADKDAVSKSIKLSNIKEVSYDKEKQARECTGVVDLAVGEAKIVEALPIAYSITWQNRDEREFYLQLHPVGK